MFAKLFPTKIEAIKRFVAISVFGDLSNFNTFLELTSSLSSNSFNCAGVNENKATSEALITALPNKKSSTSTQGPVLLRNAITSDDILLKNFSKGNQSKLAELRSKPQ
jgi:hypothetical protein